MMRPKWCIIQLKSLFTKEDGSRGSIRYMDKKRIQSWLNVNRLQLPLHNLDLDSNVSIRNPEEIVKQNSSTDSDGETSAKIPVGTSSRVALVDALEGLSRRDEEKRLVNTYRTYIKNAQADQARLVKTRKEIARLRKEGDPNKRIPKLQQAV